jgi:penicillin-binding protein 2
MDSTNGSPSAGYQKWWDMMSVFGYGKVLGIDLKGEKRGNLPTVKYYNKVFGTGSWRAATVISNAIGQGEVLATPLQIANAMAAIANRGYYITPKVCKYLVKDKKYRVPKKTRTNTGYDTVYYRYVVDGLEKVVLAGTAQAAQIPDISFCGKTGTAQNPHGKDHSIFAGFAPKNNPKIAIAVFVENAGFGATYAAPIASLMVEKFIHDSISVKRKPLEERMIKAHLIKSKEEVELIKKQQQHIADSIAKVKLVKDSLGTVKSKNNLKTVVPDAKRGNSPVVSNKTNQRKP